MNLTGQMKLKFVHRYILYSDKVALMKRARKIDCTLISKLF